MNEQQRPEPYCSYCSKHGHDNSAHFNPHPVHGPRGIPEPKGDLGGRVAFLEGALAVARDKIAGLEQACGLPSPAPLTLEQRVQALEMAWQDIAEQLLEKVRELGAISERLHNDCAELLASRGVSPDTTRPEDPTL